MPTGPPYLPKVTLPAQAATGHGELVRLRQLVAREPRVNTSSEFDEWGPFDLDFDEEDHGRAMIEVRPTGDPSASWTPVGDMSWHAELHGPTLACRAVTIGVGLAPAERGRGIGTVAQSLLAAALHRAGVHRVQAWTDPANGAELRALDRAGFVREGVARQAQMRADGRHDLILCSCLPGEPTVPPD